VALQLGLGVALGEAGLSLALRDRAWLAAQEIGLGTWSGAAPETGALCLAIPSARADAVQDALAAAGILVKFANPKRDEPHLSAGPANHVPMRIAAHDYNNDAEIDALTTALRSAR
jgi:selenocysteine lyase/cysteine desulfurase